MPDGRRGLSAGGCIIHNVLLSNRMYRLSRVAGIKKSAYDMRHGFATRKLVQGHDHLTVAEPMGGGLVRDVLRGFSHLQAESRQSSNLPYNRLHTLPNTVYTAEHRHHLSVIIVFTSRVI